MLRLLRTARKDAGLTLEQVAGQLRDSAAPWVCRRWDSCSAWRMRLRVKKSDFGAPT